MARTIKARQSKKCPTDPCKRASALSLGVRKALLPRAVVVVAGLLAAHTGALVPTAVGAPFPAVFELTSLLPENGGDGSEGFVLYGYETAASSGGAVSEAGDVNGDGLDDLIVGARGANAYNRPSAGQSYVVFGRSRSSGGFPAVIELSSLAEGDGTVGFALDGVDAGDQSGVSVSTAGDVNADGIDDLIIGAWWADPGDAVRAGESYLVFGRDVQSGNGFPGRIELSSLSPANGGDGSAGVVLTGIDINDYSGIAVSNAGDINGDSVDDVVIGARFGDPGGRISAGESYVVFGRSPEPSDGLPAEIDLADLSTGDGTTGFVVNGVASSSWSGSAVGEAGDVNGDGLDDLVIGAFVADPDGRFDAGQSYVLFGKDTTASGAFPSEFDALSLVTGDGSLGFVMNGFSSSDWTGHSVHGAGDVNGDGVADVIVGAPGAGSFWRAESGSTYVVFGQDSAQSGSFPPTLELSSVVIGDGSSGFVVYGIESLDWAGSAVSSAGDINGDKLDDLLIGSTANESYVVFGRDTAKVGNFPAEVELSDLRLGNGEDGFVLRGAGHAVSAAGDVNGDGVGDLIIGAPYASVNGISGAGITYVLFGRVDSDADGLHDAADNCTGTPNPDQRDTDGDGFGNACDADLSNDCTVNFLDLNLLKMAFLGQPYDPDADFDGDGLVNFGDLARLKGTFFNGPNPGPGPSGLSNDCDEL